MMNKTILHLFILVFISLRLSAQTDLETRYERALEKTGDYIQIGLPATALAMSIIEKDWEGTKQFALSFGTNLAITHSMKSLLNKKRPEGSAESNAFPSGHTSAAFQGASFIQRRYGWKHGKFAYLLAAFVGYSRIEGLNDRHDLWDVLGGAAVGIGSTYIFTKPFEKKLTSVLRQIMNIRWFWYVLISKPKGWREPACGRQGCVSCQSHWRTPTYSAESFVTHDKIIALLKTNS